MSPKASSPAGGDPLSSQSLLRDPHDEDIVRGMEEPLNLLGPWVKEAATESGDIKDQHLRWKDKIPKMEGELQNLTLRFSKHQYSLASLRLFQQQVSQMGQQGVSN